MSRMNGLRGRIIAVVQALELRPIPLGLRPTILERRQGDSRPGGCGPEPMLSLAK